jgi:hypothetical protein
MFKREEILFMVEEMGTDMGSVVFLLYQKDFDVLEKVIINICDEEHNHLRADENKFNSDRLVMAEGILAKIKSTDTNI